MLILFAAWWFWITLTMVVALIICEATESPIVATVTVIAGALALQFLGDVNWWAYLKSNPFEVIKLVGLYFGLGTGWCVAKWYFYVLNRRDEYRERKESFCKEHKLEDGIIPDNLVKSFQSSFLYYRKNDYPPSAGKHKRRIIQWITYWPFSAVWTLIDDVVQRIAKSIYNLISTALQKISDKVFEKDLVR